MIWIQYAIIGVALGSIYALAGLGLVVIFRTTRVLNIAHAAMGTFIAYVDYELLTRLSLPFWVAFAISLILAAVLGAVVYLLVFRRLRGKSLTTTLVASVGVLLTLNAAVTLIQGGYGTIAQAFPSGFPRSAVRVAGLYLGMDQIAVMAVAAGLAIALFAGLRYTSLGLEARAVADDPDLAATRRINPDRIGALSWMIGSTLAGLAAILVAPFTLLAPWTLSAYMFKALGAMVLGGLVGLGGTIVGGVFLGVAESMGTGGGLPTGLQQAIPFIAIVVYLLVRRKGREEWGVRMGRRA